MYIRNLYNKTPAAKARLANELASCVLVFKWYVMCKDTTNFKYGQGERMSKSE